MSLTVDLRLGDCVELARQLDSQSIDLVLTSPPYDDLREYGGHKWDFEALARELFRVTRGVVVWIVGDATVNGSETGTSFRQALYFKELGFNLHDTMIYQKTGFSFPSKNRYHQAFEYMFVFSRGAPKTFNPIKDIRVKYGMPWGRNTHRQRDGSLVERKKQTTFNPLGMRTNIWKINCTKGFNTKDEYDHPAIFPERLAADHIQTWTNPGDTVLDPMMGSGTTGKMAVLAGRNFIGFEIESKYFGTSKRRIEIAKSQALML